MPTRLISNVDAPGFGPLPQTGWTVPVPPLNEQVLLECVNTSAGTVTHGDVMVVDTSASANSTTGWIPFPAVAAPPISPQAGGVAVTTTTSANDKNVLGPISITGDASSLGTGAPTIAIGQACWVVIGGVARVQIGGQTVVAKDSLFTFTNAKQANAVTLPVIANVGSYFGVALEANAAKDAASTIRAIIRGS